MEHKFKEKEGGFDEKDFSSILYAIAAFFSIAFFGMIIIIITLLIRWIW